MKDLKYYKDNATEDYITTPISVLRYITELEKNNSDQQLILSGVVDSLTDKEKIDYEIAQKRKESEDNMKSWLYAMFFTLVIIIVGFNILKSCSS